MTRLIAAEFRKLLTTRLWLWLLLTSLAWTAGYCALAIAVDNRPGGPGPALSGAAGQHALFAIGAGGAGPLAAILAAAGTAGEFRHRTAAATFLAEPRRARVITAKLIVYLLAGAAYALACVAVSLAVALPWLAARGTPLSLAAHGNLSVLGAVIISVALFGITGAGLGASPSRSCPASARWVPGRPTCRAWPLTASPRPARRACGCCRPGRGVWCSPPGPSSSPAAAPPSPLAGTSPEAGHPMTWHSRSRRR